MYAAVHLERAGLDTKKNFLCFALVSVLEEILRVLYCPPHGYSYTTGFCSHSKQVPSVQLPQIYLEL